MKQWILREPISEKISKELESWPELVRQLLFYRGIKTKKEAEKFFNPNYEKGLNDPFKILNMEKAVDRILSAIKKNERIIIFGDYDADGVCASVIFHEFFKKVGFENFHVHIPDRHLDGYGLTLESIDEFKKQEAKLIITLDCGITDYDEIEKANKSGIDTVVIDHHLPPEKLPPACAIVDVKQEKDKYLFKDLCGTGVAFKVICALVKKGGFNIVSGWEKWLLDLVAIATITEMVPLMEENRVLVFYGLQVLRKTKRPGLLSFYRRMEMVPVNINEDDVGFMIAPRINVASRMEHANTSFELLTTESSEEADWLTGRIELLNKDRRNIVEAILQEVDEKIEIESIPPIIVKGDINWNPGVLGLVATRLVEKYGRPAVLWGKERAKEIKGVCRSDGTVNVVDLMTVLPKDILLDFGGHAFAGGFSIKEGKIDDLEKEILRAYKKILKQKTENEILYIDKEIGPEEVNWEFYGQIEKFQPFGMDNPKPVFMFSELEIANIKKFGNGGIHLQLDFKKSNGEKISAIGFFIANAEKYDLKTGQKIDLVATLEKSTFRNSLELRLRIVDVKLR